MDRLVRAASLIEGLSYLLLLGIAMPLKYAWGYPLAVQIAGSLHGGLFVVLLLAVGAALIRGRIRVHEGFMVMALSLVPFGAFFLEWKWRQRDRRPPGPSPEPLPQS